MDAKHGMNKMSHPLEKRCMDATKESYAAREREISGFFFLIVL